jgi:hypothetical protein
MAVELEDSEALPCYSPCSSLRLSLIEPGYQHNHPIRKSSCLYARIVV